jgi:hypothetical protein
VAQILVIFCPLLSFWTIEQSRVTQSLMIG